MKVSSEKRYLLNLFLSSRIRSMGLLPETRSRRNVGRSTRRGAVIMLMIIILPVLLIICTFAINLSYMELARTDMQIASDAAARAAARTFARTDKRSDAVAAAQTATLRNPIVGKALNLRSSDVIFGASTRSSGNGKYVFTANRTPFNSVRVSFDSKAGGSLPLPLRVGVKSPKFSPRQIATATQAELDLVIVVDRSGSMAFGSDEGAIPGNKPKRAPPGWDFDTSPVPPKSRWSEAQAAVSEFLKILQSSAQRENVGLVTYSHSTEKDVLLTQTYSQITAALGQYNSPFKKGGTNIGGGIGSGLEVLESSPAKRQWAVRVMIVLTDGIHNMGWNPVDAAREAARQNVVIYTVTFAQEADQALMKQVAEIGLGKHYHSPSGAQLIKDFKEIAQNLPVLLTE